MFKTNNAIELLNSYFQAHCCYELFSNNSQNETNLETIFQNGVKWLNVSVFIIYTGNFAIAHMNIGLLLVAHSFLCGVLRNLMANHKCVRHLYPFYAHI